METTEAGSSTDPQKKYAINILAWDVAILCYFSEAAATMVNQSGKDIWCTGAAILTKLTVFLSKNLVIHSLTLQQTTPLNLNINGLKYSSPMENKLDFPSFQEKKKSFLLSRANLFQDNWHLRTSKHSVNLQKSYKHESAWLGDLLQYWSNRLSRNIWHAEVSVVSFFSSEKLYYLCNFFFHNISSISSAMFMFEGVTANTHLKTGLPLSLVPRKYR